MRDDEDDGEAEIDETGHEPEPTRRMRTEDGDADPSIQYIDKTIEILVNRRHESDPSPRVQLAIDKLAIAACERASRIFRADVA